MYRVAKKNDFDRIEVVILFNTYNFMENIKKEDSSKSKIEEIEEKDPETGKIKKYLIETNSTTGEVKKIPIKKYPPGYTEQYLEDSIKRTATPTKRGHFIADEGPNTWVSNKKTILNRLIP